MICLQCNGKGLIIHSGPPQPCPECGGHTIVNSCEGLIAERELPAADPAADQLPRPLPGRKPSATTDR